MKSRKAEIKKRYHKIPQVRFAEGRRLTSFGGLVVFQLLFRQLDFKARIERCFKHIDTQGIFGLGNIVFVLVVHILLGFRRLRGLDYYRHDPMATRVCGLSVLPDASTVSRNLGGADEDSVKQLRKLLREICIHRIESEGFARITVDFDGSVQSTKGHAEGVAVGFNKQKKGARSYYPLFATISQLGVFYDFHHRSGNVHDSNGAPEFIARTLLGLREALPGIALECRIDSAFYNETIFSVLEKCRSEFTCSVPFERFPSLKKKIEQCAAWKEIDDRWSCFESDWKPEKWNKTYRLIFIRQKRPAQRKGPVQLDLFAPRDDVFEYKVIATNKKETAKIVMLFHNGRGSQEKIFGEGKQHGALDYIATRKLIGNQIFTLSGMFAHNLGRELQMSTREKDRKTVPKRAAQWEFQSLGTLRQHLLHTAAELTRPQGELTLTMNDEKGLRRDITRMMKAFGAEECIDKAA